MLIISYLIITIFRRYVYIISYKYVNFVKMFQILFKNLRKSFYINLLNNLSINNCILNLSYCLNNIIIKMIIFFF